MIHLSKRVQKQLLFSLSKALCKRYGLSHYFTWKQVLKTVEDEFLILREYLEYAYALFCREEEFVLLAETCNFKSSYYTLRENLEVSPTNEIPFWKSGVNTGWVTLDEPNADAFNGAHFVD